MSGTEDQNKIPVIGDAAPAFVAETTQGQIKFPDE